MVYVGGWKREVLFKREASIGAKAWERIVGSESLGDRSLGVYFVGGSTS